MKDESKIRIIRELNDQLRTQWSGGRMMMTSGVQALPPDRLATLLTRVRTFDAFTKDNDPHGEHDFGAIEIEGETYFFKIDYYDRAMEPGSEDPADPEQTVRVLLVMHSSEY